MAVAEPPHIAAPVETRLPETADFGLEADRRGPVRAEDFEQWVQEEGNPLELVEGWVVPMSPGTMSAGTLASRLAALLLPIADERGWTLAFDARHRLSAPPETVLFPDLVIHCAEPEYAPGTETVVRAPELVIEILGARTARRDVGPDGVKYLAYQMSGVQEYYVTWPDGREAAGYRLSGGRFVPLERDSKGFFASPLLDRRLRLVPPALGD
jgi:Uma2 family endonuclease